MLTETSFEGSGDDTELSDAEFDKVYEKAEDDHFVVKLFAGLAGAVGCARIETGEDVDTCCCR